MVEGSVVFVDAVIVDGGVEAGENEGVRRMSSAQKGLFRHYSHN